MKITVFTGNQPRHLALVRRLAAISDRTYALLECNTLFPGSIEDFFRRSKVMQRYFRNVIDAERKLFGNLAFLSGTICSLPMKSGDLNSISRQQLRDALDSDVYVVFGSSYIKGWLAQFLVAHRAINIHMGLSPYYRGSSCNFWALYDDSPAYVGATIHLLSRGLDSGSILYHALPQFSNESPYEFTMRAVEAAQKSLVDRIASGELAKFIPQAQDVGCQIRYTRNADFNDEVAATFLSREMSPEILAALLERSTRPKLVQPFYA